MDFDSLYSRLKQFNEEFEKLRRETDDPHKIAKFFKSYGAMDDEILANLKQDLNKSEQAGYDKSS